jgi:hypothetical protein
MLGQRWPIKEEIIEERKGVTLKEYLSNLIDMLVRFESKKTKRGGILDGLGQLLKDEKERLWVKEHLVEELILMLRLFLENR